MREGDDAHVLDHLRILRARVADDEAGQERSPVVADGQGVRSEPFPQFGPPPPHAVRGPDDGRLRFGDADPVEAFGAHDDARAGGGGAWGEDFGESARGDQGQS
ncbi:Uncharacterised protein [Mycobacteroides abscessus subsp. abscessus]|nr:Uncharacterised protein [Mycobacteroides abscessus subsp. abscessus]